MNNTIINEVLEKLQSYPHINFELQDENSIFIYPENQTGFTVGLIIQGGEMTLYFNEYHWHFTENEREEVLNQLACALSGIIRLKVFSKNKKDYKWTVQVEDSTGVWQNLGTTAIINLNFWTKAQIHYLQNKLLKIEP